MGHFSQHPEEPFLLRGKLHKLLLLASPTEAKATAAGRDMFMLSMEGSSQSGAWLLEAAGPSLRISVPREESCCYWEQRTFRQSEEEIETATGTSLGGTEVT